MGSGSGDSRLVQGGRLMSGVAFNHVAVLQDELVGALALREGGAGIDCTAGGGGHLDLMLRAFGPKGRVYGIDRDPEAVVALKSRFEKELCDRRLCLLQGPFSEMLGQVPCKVDAIAADFGVSSPQLDQGQRGFSFMKEGPLDMRMNPQDPVCAADIVRDYSCEQLAEIFRLWGEEPKALLIARAIVRQREISPITSTIQLADLIRASVRYKTGSRKHPATRVFQALRICVNSELDEISSLLDQALAKLKPGGRLGVITFHSLEDRMVKQFCKKSAGQARDRPVLRGLPLTEKELSGLIRAKAKIIRPFPVKPSEQEISQNPRSRSARLRVLEKL